MKTKQVCSLLVSIIMGTSLAFGWGTKKHKPAKPIPPSTNANSISSATGVGVGIGGSSRSQAAGGKATATGGSSSIKDSGNSTASALGGAGGSSNQKQGQQQQQTNAQTVSGIGNGQNTTTITYDEKRQVHSAIAPDSLPTSPCIKGYGGAAQTGFFGLGLGGGKVDKGCDDRETARSFALLGNRLAAAKILCGTNAAKRAKLTMEDCLAQQPEVELVPYQEPAQSIPPIVNPPQVEAKPDIAPPVAIIPSAERTRSLIGICSFPSSMVCLNYKLEPGEVAPPQVNTNRVGSACRKMLDSALKALDSPNSILEVKGDDRHINSVKSYLAKSGDFDEDLVTFRVTRDMKTVELWIVR